MNGLERCLRVLRGGMPDRVPVLPSMTSFAVWYAGYQMKDVVYDAEKLADCMIRTCEDFELDGIELALDTAISPEALGAKVAFREDDTAVCVGGAISSYSEVKNLPLVDPHRDGRIPIYLKTVGLMRKKLGDKVLILNSIGLAPFSLACSVRGMQEAMSELVELDNPHPMEGLIEHCERCLERIALAYYEEGSHLVYCGDSLASPELVSPRVYAALAYPGEKKLAEYVKGLGLYFGIHICGNSGPILSLLAQTGADMIDVDYKTDLTACRQAVGDRAVIRGTLDPSSVLRFGDPELVDRLCRENIAVLGRKGRFFLAAGCDIMRDTPAQNVRAMVEASRRYVDFDIPIQTDS